MQTINTIEHPAVRLAQPVSLQDFTAAQPLLERSLEIYRKTGDHWSIAFTLHNLGIVSYHQKDYATARGHYQEALSLAWDSGDRTGISCTLLCLGMIAVGVNENGRAARLFGAAESIREVFEVPLPDSERIDYERDVELLRASMPIDHLINTWEEGRSLTPELAVQYALENSDIVVWVGWARFGG